MTVHYTRRAQRDLAKILDDIEKESPQGALNVSRALKRAIETIEQFPNTGYLAGHGTARGLAVIPYPYIIYWIVTGSDAQIVHIRHGARQTWTGRN
jgi:plasmid stabilization system protein ParE